MDLTSHTDVHFVQGRRASASEGLSAERGPVHRETEAESTHSVTLHDTWSPRHGAVGTWKPEDPPCMYGGEGKNPRGRQWCSWGRSNEIKARPGKLTGEGRVSVGKESWSLTSTELRQKYFMPHGHCQRKGLGCW